MELRDDESKIARRNLRKYKKRMQNQRWRNKNEKVRNFIEIKNSGKKRKKNRI